MQSLWDKDVTTWDDTLLAASKPSLKRKFETEETVFPEMPHQIKRMRRKECTVCFNDLALNQFKKVRHSGKRTNCKAVCARCWTQHMDAEVGGKAWDAIGCAECDRKLEELDIKLLASKTIYQA